jgi:hypothetical protein
MKYHIYIQDEEAGDIAERHNPASEGVGYLVEDRFEAENLEEATKIAQKWIAQRILSRPRDPVTVFIAELETGEHRHLKVTLPLRSPSPKPTKTQGSPGSKNAARSWTACSGNASGITTTTMPRFHRLGWSKLARPSRRETAGRGLWSRSQISLRDQKGYQVLSKKTSSAPVKWPLKGSEQKWKRH